MGNFSDLMIDLETAGTAANAPVISIGAVYFDRETGELGDKFDGRIDVADALRYGKMSGSPRPWGNGASFDITILDVAFPRILNKQPPWKFWDVRDCRTIKDLANCAGYKYAGDRAGTHHGALDDAIYQAQWTSYYWQKLTGKTIFADDVDDLLGGA